MKRLSWMVWSIILILVLGFGLYAGFKIEKAIADMEIMDLQAQLGTANASLADANVQLESNRVVVLAWDALASHYTNKSSGKTMANGKPFNEDHLTVAHRGIKFGTVLVLENQENGKVTSAIVTDRGPAKWTGRSLDVSLAVARRLGIVDQGVAKLRCYLMVDGRPSRGN
jgi:rare lipoprotein A